jgi:hypothetical protein
MKIDIIYGEAYPIYSFMPLKGNLPYGEGVEVSRATLKRLKRLQKAQEDYQKLLAKLLGDTI